MAPKQATEVADEFVDELKPGTTLLNGQYTIVRFLNSGGFGITYLAKDSLDRVVVIKECFPGAFGRRENTSVVARSRAHQGELAIIVKLFVQEAKGQAKLIHPNIVGVHQVFEDNDTAYMAIDLIEGRDLMDIIETDAAALSPPMLVAALKKLLGAIAFVHQHGTLHRDISPDNILIRREDDEPILIDFGAARQKAAEIGGRAMSAMRVVKDGYSPQEFYVKGSVQNESSDLYALAASFHHAITGKAPTNSQARLVAIAEGRSDPYVPLAGRIRGYPEGFLAAMDKALKVLPKDRIQTAGDWLEMIDRKPDLKVIALSGRQVAGAVRAGGASGAVATTAAIDAAADGLPAKAAASGNGNRIALLASAVALVAVAVGMAGYRYSAGGANPVATAPIAAAPSEAPAAAAEVAPETSPLAEDASAAPELPAPTGTEEPEAPAAPATDVAANVAATPGAAPEAPTGTPAAVVLSTEPATPPVTPPKAATAIAEAPAESPDAAGSSGSDARLAPAPEVAVAETPAEAPQGMATETATETVSLAEAKAPMPAGVATGDAPVAARQVERSGWRIQLPFEVAAVTVAGRSFPAISGLVADAEFAPENSWVAEGVIIYAVNGSWVSDLESIEAVLRGASEFGDSNFLYTAVRIKTDPAAPFSEVTLAAASKLVIDLSNGTRFHAEVVDGAWLTVVEVAGDPVEGGLVKGDIVLTENVTGEALAGAHSLEAIVAKLARNRQPFAQFTVLRDGAEVAASMPLMLEKR